MIVRQFLQWVRTAPAGARAEATRALARAYLHSPMTEGDRSATEGALVMMLDDTSPLVRQALADVLASSANAPPSVIRALIADLPDIAGHVLARSPLLRDSDLVDVAGGGEPAAQAAISRRSRVSCVVAAALAEVGSAEACLILLENPRAMIAPFSLERIAERHGHLAAIREAMFAREDLPASLQQRLARNLGESLIKFVTSRDWMAQERARHVVQESCEKVTVAIAATARDEEVQPLVRHLVESGQLNLGLLLRALLSGNIALFEEAVAELSGLPLARVARLVQGRSCSGLSAALARAGLPHAALPVIWSAIEAGRELGFAGAFDSEARLKRPIVERVLAECEAMQSDAMDPLLVLLRKFALEATREEARLFCSELAAA
jgi:uncharacterized protein (DUF2336 family)